LNGGEESLGDSLYESDTLSQACITWCYVTDLEGNIVELQARKDE
jgi:hypothetical protein